MKVRLKLAGCMLKNGNSHVPLQPHATRAHRGASAAAAEARVGGKDLVMHGKISALASCLVHTEDIVDGFSEVASKISEAARRREDEREGLSCGGVE